LQVVDFDHRELFDFETTCQFYLGLSNSENPLLIQSAVSSQSSIRGKLEHKPRAIDTPIGYRNIQLRDRILHFS
jgi:hypothetical protein